MRQAESFSPLPRLFFCGHKKMSLLKNRLEDIDKYVKIRYNINNQRLSARKSKTIYRRSLLTSKPERWR